MRFRLRGAIIGACFVLLIGVAVAIASRTGVGLSRTNCIIIVLDAARPDHLSFNGYGRRTSPNIDALARDSVVFDQAYSTAAYTLAAAPSLLTSMYPWDHQVLEVWDTLSAGFRTLPECFSEAGFVTGAFIGNGFALHRARPRLAFDDLITGSISNEGIPEPWDEIAENVFKWIDGWKGRRFFALAWIAAPHNPYMPPDKYVQFLDPPGYRPFECTTDELVKKATNTGNLSQEDLAYIAQMYDANLLYADAFVGTIVEGLKKRGLYRNTAIWVLSDHGEALGEHGNLLHSTTVYEEMSRIVSVLKPAGSGPQGQRIGTPMSLIDVMPTLISLFDLRIPETGMEGADLSPSILEGKPLKRELLGFRSDGKEPQYGIRVRQYKYILDVKAGAQHLFDLSKDPWEETDISGEYPWVCEEGKKILESMRAVGDWYRKPDGSYAKIDPETMRQFKALGYLR